MAQHRERLEDPRRDGTAGDRDAQRLVELAGLDLEALEQGGEGRLDLLRLEGVDGTESLLRDPQDLSGFRLHHLRPRLRIVDRRLEEEADQRPDLVERL